MMESPLNNVKSKLFHELGLMKSDSEVIKIRTEKVKLKNKIVNDSYNVHLSQESSDYRKVENLSDKLIEVKKQNRHSKNSFNISDANSSHVKPGQILPISTIKFVNDKIFHFPRNKINILLFISRNFNFQSNSENSSKLLKFLNNQHVSSLHISLYKTINEGLFEYSREFIYLKRELGVTKLPYAIAYDSKLRVIWTGDLKELMEEKTLQLIEGKNKGAVTNSQYNIQNTTTNTSNNTDNSGNTITEENKPNYLKLKADLGKLNRKNMREMKCKLENVEIKLRSLKKYHISPVNSESVIKIIYKPSIDYNEKATIKDKTGKFIDNLIVNYKSIMHFISYENEVDYQKYLKYGLDYYYTNILQPLNLVGVVQLGVKLEEKIGLCNIKLKYSIYNITPFCEVLDLNAYYNIVLKAVDEYALDYTNKQLKDSVYIETNYYAIKPGKMVVPAMDENMNQITLEMKENEVNIIYIVSVFNPLFLQMFAANLPLIEAIHKNLPEGKTLPKINSYFAIMTTFHEVEITKSCREYKEFKNYISADPNSRIVFVDVDVQLIDWMEYELGEEVGAMIITPEGEKIYLCTDDFIIMDTTLKRVLNGTLTYTIEKKTYEDLKDFSKKLVKVKLADLEYNPYFYYNLTHTSELMAYNKDVEMVNDVYTAQFFCRLRKKDKGSMAPFIKKTKQIMNQTELDFYEELVEVTDIPLGEVCSKCNATIKGLGELHFYCYWCKIHFCSKCGNTYNQEKQDHKDKLPHEHFLTLIKVQNQSGMKNIDTYKFGNNIWHKYYNQESALNSYDCIGCSTPCIRELRHICLSCRPGCLRGQEEEQIDKGGFVDICPRCMQIVLSDEWKNDEKLTKRFEKENHDFSSHVYLRIDCNTGNYYFY